ncbi:MAG: ABC transporter permease subunit [Chlorobi bacterium]|nr:ABC transporter permease subunit [Chlorobiota bacterium]
MNNRLTQNLSEIKPSKQLSIVAALILIYIVLFEFVFIPVRFIPKPSILFESFMSLWDSYNLAALLFSTTSIIYISLLLGSMLVTFSAKYLLKIIYEYPGILNLSTPFKYFTVFFFAIIFNLWFSDSFIAEFIFAILFVFAFIISSLITESKKEKEEYVLAARSLGLNKDEIYSKIIWKELQPKIFGGLLKLHVSLWMIVLIYEFVGQTEGVGALYFSAYQYNDIGAIIALGILISLLILIGNMLIKYLNNKIFFWE